MFSFSGLDALSTVRHGRAVSLQRYGGRSPVTVYERVQGQPARERRGERLRAAEDAEESHCAESKGLENTDPFLGKVRIHFRIESLPTVLAQVADLWGRPQLLTVTVAIG